MSWQAVIPGRSHQCGIEWLIFRVCSSAQVCKSFWLHDVRCYSKHSSRGNMKVLADIRSKRDLSKALVFHSHWLRHWTYSHLSAEGIKSPKCSQPVPLITCWVVHDQEHWWCVCNGLVTWDQLSYVSKTNSINVFVRPPMVIYCWRLSQGQRVSLDMLTVPWSGKQACKEPMNPLSSPFRGILSVH